MAYTVPQFNGVCDIYESADSIHPTTLRQGNVPCQLYGGPKGEGAPVIRLPARTDVRTRANSATGHDDVIVYKGPPGGPAVNITFEITYIADVARDFPNEYRSAFAVYQGVPAGPIQ